MAGLKSREKSVGGRDIGVDGTYVRVARPGDLPDVLRWAMHSPGAFVAVSPERLADHFRQAEVVVLNREAVARGFMAAQVRPFHVAVITAASVEPPTQAAACAGLLLDELERVLGRQGLQALAQVGYAPWLADVLRSHGFVSREQIVTFEWLRQPVTICGEEAVQVSAAAAEDLPHLLKMDKALFGPVWHKGPLEFSASFERSCLFTVARFAGQIVGYQWCDRTGNHAHLTRLAVATDWQNRGIGSRLLTETLKQLTEAGVALVTLNTQSGNEQAQRLYLRHGFRPLQDKVDLLWKDL